MRQKPEKGIVEYIYAVFMFFFFGFRRLWEVQIGALTLVCYLNSY